MNNLRIVAGKQKEMSLHERIAQQLSRLSEGNKKYCLELIMSLHADERMLFLNAFMVAVAKLPESNVAAA